jgi:sulfonate transport system permease protein
MEKHEGHLISEKQIPKKVKTGNKRKSNNNFKNTKSVLIASIVPITLIIVWEIVCRLGIVPPYQLPAPSTILTTLQEMVIDGSLWGHIGITTYRVLIGFSIGTIFALIIGSLVGLYGNVEKLIDPTLQAFRNIPSLAWVPLFILWLGIGESSKVVLIAVGVFFPVYLNVVSGISGVDRKLIEVGKMYGLSTFQLTRRVILPAVLPSFLVGIRVGLGSGWMFVVASELMGASEGLGYLLVLGQNTLAPETILVSIIMFAILGKLSDWVIQQIESRSLKWQDSFTKS